MRKICLILVAAGFLVCCSTMVAFADWQPGDGHKMHYPQLPDETGWDVNATKPIVLADDWLCSETGPVTDIHFWGSWLGGNTGEILGFVLSIHADIPADPPQIPYSRPGDTLWEREIHDFIALPIDPPTEEGWYDPSTGQWTHPDHGNYFQYNVFLPKDDWFWQEEGKIYWLNISAIVMESDPQPVWGWKSSIDHWNDDAVWGYWGELNWIDMWEPPDFSQSLDLSFVITGGIDDCDFGDAPDPGYSTLLASNGAVHGIVPGFFMGACIDAKPDGLQDPNALGDDHNNFDDEDGVAFTSVLALGRTAGLTVTASAAGFLDAWVDFNDDGHWGRPGRTDLYCQGTGRRCKYPVFCRTKNSHTHEADLRPIPLQFHGRPCAPTGYAADGEVEDYEVAIRSTLPWLLLLLFGD